MIRSVTLADVPWLVDLSIACHAPFDIAGFTTWISNLIKDPRVIGLRGEHSAAFAVITRPPWDGDERNCELLHLYSRPDSGSALEPIRLIRAVNDERKARGAGRFFIVSTLSDLSPIARRLGARPIGSLHVMDDAA